MSSKKDVEFVEISLEDPRDKDSESPSPLSPSSSLPPVNYIQQLTSQPLNLQLAMTHLNGLFRLGSKRPLEFEDLGSFLKEVF